MLLEVGRERGVLLERVGVCMYTPLPLLEGVRGVYMHTPTIL